MRYTRRFQDGSAVYVTDGSWKGLRGSIDGFDPNDNTYWIDFDVNHGEWIDGNDLTAELAAFAVDDTIVMLTDGSGYCISNLRVGDVGRIVSGPDGDGDYRVHFPRTNDTWYVKPSMMRKESTMTNPFFVGAWVRMRASSQTIYRITYDLDCDNDYCLARVDGEGRAYRKPHQLEFAYDHNAALAELRKGNKIMAIKIVREGARCGIKDAKDYVESIPLAATGTTNTLDMTREVERLTREIESLRSSIEFKRDEFRRLNDDHAKITRELESANAKIDQLLRLMTADQLIQVIKGN